MSDPRPSPKARRGESNIPPKAPTLPDHSSRSTSSRPTPDAADASNPRASLSSRTSQNPIARSPAQAGFKIPPSPRTDAASSGGEGPSKAAKIAIPRLKRTHDGAEHASKPGGRHRVTHACEPCRHRKTKCSGERPICRHCQDFKIHCYYADGKRDRVKKQFGSLTEKVADYERLLRDLMSRASLDDADMIKSMLDRAAQQEFDDPSLDGLALPSVEPDTAADGDDDNQSGAESEVSGDAGSTGALDRVEEDFTREGARETGFMGKNSEISWLQRIRQEHKYGDAKDPQEAANKFEPEDAFAVQDYSYHLNDLDIISYEAVDPYEMPPVETAHILFQTYMDRVHPAFPIVGRLNLYNQFIKFLRQPSVRPPANWLAIINLIMAIAARYSHLVQADFRADEHDHIIYFTRARLLTITSESLFAHPDLQYIQVIGLMAYYLMTTEQVNRAWILTGQAIRAATGLGLNMRNESPALSNPLKEIRYRVWWALYTLEHRLCSMTGRANCIVDELCTSPLPVPVAEEDFDTDNGRRFLSNDYQANDRAPASNVPTPPNPRSGSSSTEGSRSVSKADGKSPLGSNQQQQQTELDWARNVAAGPDLFYLHYVQLCRFTQRIFQELYNPVAITLVWSDIQARITALQTHLESYYRQLPPAFDFKDKRRGQEHTDARLTLGMLYYSASQMLHRPCLCRLDRKVPHQSNKSHEFNHAAAVACVNAALDQIALIPDKPDAIGQLKQGPWSTIVHLLVQSLSVLMLEISFRAHHMPERVDDLIAAATKVIYWLHALGEYNLAAARAWKICSSILHASVAKVGRQLGRMPAVPPATMQPTYSHQQQFQQSSHGHDQQAMQHHHFEQLQNQSTMYMNSIQPHYGMMQGYDVSFDQHAGLDQQNMHFSYDNQQYNLDGMDFGQGQYQPDSQRK